MYLNGDASYSIKLEIHLQIFEFYRSTIGLAQFADARQQQLVYDRGSHC